MRELGQDTTPFQNAMQGDYEFSLGQVFRQGWGLFIRKFPSFVGFTVLFFLSSMFVVFLVAIGMAFTTQLVFFNWLFVILGYLLILGFVYSFAGGMFLACDKLVNEGEAEFADFFKGLRAIISVGAAKLIQLLLVVVPLMIVLIATGWLENLMPRTDPSEFATLEELQAYSQQLRPLSLAASVPQILVFTIYLFTTPLILLGRLQFWTAMETSRKIVVKKFPAMLALTLSMAALLTLGSMLAVIGLLFTIPLIYTITYAAYASVSGQGQDNLLDKIDSIGKNSDQ